MDPVHDYPGYQPGRKRQTPWLGIALAVAVVIIVVLAAVVITQMKDKDSDSAAPTTSTPQSTVQALPQPNAPQPQTPIPTNAGPSMTCEGFTANIDPQSQPGWHATINHFGLAYAVPPDWTVAACGVRMGWAKPCPQGQCVIREIGAVSTVANPACTDQNLAMAGVTGSKNPDLRAALEEEMQTVPLIYSQDGVTPKVEYAPIREFTIGNHPAVQTVATVNDIPPTDCTGTSALHSMVVTTVPNVEGSVVFLISLRQGINATPKPDVINKIVATLQSPA